MIQPSISEQITYHCLSHFLSKFDPRSKKRKIRDIVIEVASEVYASEIVNEFVEDNLQGFQQRLVDEFNDRYATKATLRFQIADPMGVGSWIEGSRLSKPLQDEIKFQNALHRTSANEFEKLAAILLRIIGCQEVFFTPTSHDQGVDAFGYQAIVQPTPYGITHKVLWIAQAKHYLSSTVSTGDIRELVGTKELLIARVFSTVDERYKELKIRKYAPTAIALVTTEEIPATVRRLAEAAGIFVFAASDLYHVLLPHLGTATSRGIRSFLKRQGASIPTLT